MQREKKKQTNNETENDRRDTEHSRRGVEKMFSLMEYFMEFSRETRNQYQWEMPIHNYRIS